MNPRKVGGPWVDVGGLWTPAPTHDLSSDKSERKLLANVSSLADYMEVEGELQLKDEPGNKRLGAGQGKAGQGRAGQGRAAQGRAVQGKARQGKAGQDSCNLFNVFYTE